MSVINYKGYATRIEYDATSKILVGKVLYTEDDISVVIKDPNKAEEQIQQTIDRYLAHCKKIGKIASKPFSGRFSIRTTPEDHKKIAVTAAKKGLTLNSLVNQIIKIHIAA